MEQHAMHEEAESHAQDEHDGCRNGEFPIHRVLLIAAAAQ
jgi:hypothetical protein